MDCLAKRNLCLTLALALVAAACTSKAGAGGLEISSATANLALPSDTGAIYMMITNSSNQEERLIGARVPGCGTIELHEMTMEGDMMMMRPVEGGAIVIPAGGTVELKQGGLHIMCIDKTGGFVVGQSVPVTLEFANAGQIEISAEVLPPDQMQMPSEGMDEGGMEMDQ